MSATLKDSLLGEGPEVDRGHSHSWMLEDLVWLTLWNGVLYICKDIRHQRYASFRLHRTDGGRVAFKMTDLLYIFDSGLSISMEIILKDMSGHGLVKV